MMEETTKQTSSMEEVTMNTQMEQNTTGSSQNQQPENDIVLEIITYCRKHCSRICWHSSISLLFVILLFFILYFLLPVSKTYQLNHTITLPQKGKYQIYPNGKIFNPEDLLSPNVINSIYRRLGLKEYVNFSDFYSSFSLARDERKKAGIDANFAGKLSIKNLKLEEIDQLESDYQAAIHRDDTASLIIKMIPKKGTWIPDWKATCIMYTVAKTWYDIYSKLEAQPFPQMESIERMKLVKAELDKGYYIIPLEKARSFNNSIYEMCDRLESILDKKNVCLPTGEYLSDIKERIQILQQYQINVFLSYIALHPELRSPFDRIFLISVLEQIENDLVELNERGKSIVDALGVLSARSRAGGRKSTSGPAQPASVSLQLDTGFFNSIAGLIRNDVNAKLREEYAAKIIQNRKATANLEAEKIFYQKIIGEIESSNKDIVTGKGSVPKRQLNEMIKSTFDEMFVLNKKVIQFRDLILENYASSDQFYTVDRAVILNAEKALPFKKVAIALIFLWFLGNGLVILIDFQAQKKKNEFCEGTR